MNKRDKRRTDPQTEFAKVFCESAERLATAAADHAALLGSYRTFMESMESWPKAKKRRQIKRPRKK